MIDELDHARDDEAVPQPTRARARARSDADPVNRALTIAALTMVVVIVGVLGYAVYATIRPVQQPRTALERQILATDADLQINPTSMDAWFDHVAGLTAARQYTKAIAAIERGLPLLQDKAPLLALRAEAEYRLGRGDKALATAAEALEVAGKYRKEMVAKYEQKGARITPPDIDAIVDAELVRAMIYVERNQVDKAIASYTAALKESPRMADVLAMRGSAYLKVGDTDKARADFQKALTYDPKNADALAGLARTKGESK
jgi:tetratricopeptide (TPR) repeat protein